jgi:hypothetical protein
MGCLPSAVNVGDTVKVTVPALVSGVGHRTCALRICGEHVGGAVTGGTDSVEVSAKNVIDRNTGGGRAREVVKETNALFVPFGPMHKNRDVVRVKLDKADPQ